MKQFALLCTFLLSAGVAFAQESSTEAAAASQTLAVDPAAVTTLKTLIPGDTKSAKTSPQ